jgi:hypothetical protein
VCAVVIGRVRLCDGIVDVACEVTAEESSGGVDWLIGFGQYTTAGIDGSRCLVKKPDFVSSYPPGLELAE